MIWKGSWKVYRRGDAYRVGREYINWFGNEKTEWDYRYVMDAYGGVPTQYPDCKTAQSRADFLNDYWKETTCGDS